MKHHLSITLRYRASSENAGGILSDKWTSSGVLKVVLFYYFFAKVSPRFLVVDWRNLSVRYTLVGEEELCEYVGKLGFKNGMCVNKSLL